MSTVALLRRALPFEIEFGRADNALCFGGGQPALHLPVPWLGGSAVERVFAGIDSFGEVDGFMLGEAGGLLLGCAVQPIGGSLQHSARELYERLLAIVRPRSLYRIWNYVPAINAVVNGVETYHAFCAGRAEAFEAVHGAEFKTRLPAASAVGCGGESLALVFAAGREQPRHIENAEQVPAYDYPPEHGPRSPSFSRATVVASGGKRLVFVSGTAAIKGHRTIAAGKLDQQLNCTLDNLRIVSRTAGLGADLGSGRGFQRHFKIYVRRPTDYIAVRSRLEHDLIQPGDYAIYLRADICRADLLVEIEATLVNA